MHESTSITSSHNPHLKSAIKLRQRRGRKLQNRILIDGWKEVTRASKSGVEIVELYFSSSNTDERKLTQLELLADHSTVQLFDVSESLFTKLAFGERTNELVAVAITPQRTLEEFSVDSNSLVAVIEGIEKPGNIGAVVRSACGAGISGLIVSNPVTDLFNPNVIRSSLGAIFSLPVCTAEAEEVIPWLKSHGFQIAAARVDSHMPYTNVDFRKPTAIVLGSEDKGLSPLWDGDSVLPITVPMLGGVDSLNISVSAAIIFYEALRQRQM